MGSSSTAAMSARRTSARSRPLSISCASNLRRRRRDRPEPTTMKWPLHDRPIPGRGIPLYNRFYLHAPKASHVDPVMVWGIEIDADALTSFLRERNRGGRVLLTTAHALIRATALALAQFPEMNVRVVGRRVYGFRGVNIRMGFYHRGNREIDLLVVREADAKSLEQIGQEVWQRLLQAGRGTGPRDRDLARLRRVPGFWLRQLLRVYGFLDRRFHLPTVGRLDELRGGGAMVNDLSFAGAPPMRGATAHRFLRPPPRWRGRDREGEATTTAQAAPPPRPPPQAGEGEQPSKQMQRGAANARMRASRSSNDGATIVKSFSGRT